MVSEIHANFFIDAGASTSQNMLDLIDLAKGEVRRKFGIELEEEISYVHPLDFSGSDLQVSRHPCDNPMTGIG